MATEIQLPALSPTMKEGKILKWLKNEGDKVAAGDAIAEVETDKSNLEVEAYDDGVLLKIIVPAGEVAQVGATIAFIGAKGEAVPAAAAAPKKAAEPPSPPKPAASETPPAPPAPPTPAAKLAPVPPPPARASAPAQVVQLRPSESGEGRLRASPLAKRMAQQAGVDLGGVQGSGPQGRIVKRDIQAAMSEPPPARRPSYVPGVRVEPDVVPMSSMRKLIAQRMAEVKPGVPHFYLSIDIDMGTASCNSTPGTWASPSPSKTGSSPPSSATLTGSHCRRLRPRPRSWPSAPGARRSSPRSTPAAR